MSNPDVFASQGSGLAGFLADSARTRLPVCALGVLTARAGVGTA